MCRLSTGAAWACAGLHPLFKGLYAMYAQHTEALEVCRAHVDQMPALRKEIGCPVAHRCYFKTTGWQSRGKLHKDWCQLAIITTLVLHVQLRQDGTFRAHFPCPVLVGQLPLFLVVLFSELLHSN